MVGNRWGKGNCIKENKGNKVLDRLNGNMEEIQEALEKPRED